MTEAPDAVSGGELADRRAEPPVAVAPLAGPVREEGRIAALDVLRGVAILGILPANLPSFALPASVADDAVRFMSPAPGEAVAFGLLHALVSEKFVTLFALLFGVGLALQRARAAPGLEPYLRLGWRLVLLGGLGLVHAVLLWHGDVLFYYAAIGVAALALSWAPPRALLALGGMALLVPPLLLESLARLGPLLGPGELQEPATLAAALAQPDLRGSVGLLGVGAEVHVFREGAYGDMVAARLPVWLSVAASVALFYGWRIAGLFFLGMAAMRLGLLAPGDHQRRTLRALLLAGLTLGLPIEVWQAVVKAGGPLPLERLLRVESVHQVGSLALAAAYAAAVLLLPRAWITRAPCTWLGAVGRLALTNYLGQTVVCTTIFYSYGLGLFATLTRAQLWGLALALWAAQLALSALWLRRFVMGPVEWAWRSLTWGRAQPLLRRRTQGS